METNLNKQINNGKQKFKSYYVVWKPAKTTTKTTTGKKFKSYYVVWKQQPDSFHVADGFV